MMGVCEPTNWPRNKLIWCESSCQRHIHKVSTRMDARMYPATIAARQHSILRLYGYRRQKAWWNSYCICHLKVCGRGSCGRGEMCRYNRFQCHETWPIRGARTNLQVVKSVENTISLISCIQIDCETTLWLGHWKTRKSSILRCNDYHVYGPEQTSNSSDLNWRVDYATGTRNMRYVQN